MLAFLSIKEMQNPVLFCMPGALSGSRCASCAHTEGRPWIFTTSGTWACPPGYATPAFYLLGLPACRVVERPSRLREGQGFHLFQEPRLTGDTTRCAVALKRLSRPVRFSPVRSEIEGCRSERPLPMECAALSIEDTPGRRCRRMTSLRPARNATDLARTLAPNHTVSVSLCMSAIAGGGSMSRQRLSSTRCSSSLMRFKPGVVYAIGIHAATAGVTRLSIHTRLWRSQGREPASRAFLCDRRSARQVVAVLQARVQAKGRATAWMHAPCMIP